MGNVREKLSKAGQASPGSERKRTGDGVSSDNEEIPGRGQQLGHVSDQVKPGHSRARIRCLQK